LVIHRSQALLVPKGARLDESYLDPGRGHLLASVWLRPSSAHLEALYAPSITRVLESCGHCPTEEAPQALLAFLLPFLAGEA
jgi:hypothetical protein